MEESLAHIFSLYHSCTALILNNHNNAINRIKSASQLSSSSVELGSSNRSEIESNVAAIQQLQSQEFKHFCTKFVLQQCQVKKSIWIKPRSSSFWDNDMNYFDNSDWISNFRMSRDTFCKLVHLLYQDMSAASAYVREPVPVEKRIAVALFKLASCSEYRTVGNLFGIHKSTVKKFLYMFCNAVRQKLFPNIIKMPDTDEAFLLAARNEKQTYLPMAIGFIDGTHIPILPPESGRKDFINRKQYASIVLQAVVDFDVKFRNISCMIPGSAHDATVLKASSLYNNYSKFIPSGSRTINEFDLPFYLIGDPAYPLLPWLMKPYLTTPSLTSQQESCNVYFSSARTQVELAFGRLKGRWRILLKRIDLDYRFVPTIIAVCCCLHNFCEQNKSPMPPDAEEVVANSDKIYPSPAQRNNSAETPDGRVTRDNLCKHLHNVAPLRKSFFR